LIEKCSSGVIELDNILGGGFPKGSLILIAGNPGAGKTILASQFTHAGLKNGEKSVYASFAEPRKDFLRNMKEFGMDFQAYEEKGILKLMVFPTMEKSGMTDAVGQILKQSVEFKAQRLVIDSISAILQTTNTEEVRVFIHTLFSRLVKTLGMTSILLSEIPFGAPTIGAGTEEFVADGIIILKTNLEGATERRALTVAKMRGIGTPKSSFEYLMDSKYGGISLIVLPLKTSIETAPDEKIGSGVEGLDELLCGGYYRNSITLVSGEGGVGKTTLALHAAVAHAQSGGKVLFLTWEETIGQIKRMMKNYGMNTASFNDRFVVEAYVPEALTPLHYFKLLKDLFDQYSPTFIVFDSISSVAPTLPPQEYITFLRDVQLLCKEKNITALLTSILLENQRLEVDPSPFSDNIIRMYYVREGDRIVRKLEVSKTRGSEHKDTIETFTITNKGITLNVKEPSK
jgi:circadian clock protein KaiC